MKNNEMFDYSLIETGYSNLVCVRNGEKVLERQANHNMQTHSNKKYLISAFASVSGLALALLTHDVAFAAETESGMRSIAFSPGGKRIIELLQGVGVLFGMCISLIALVEMGLGSTSWKSKLGKGLGATAGAMVIPLVFFEIQNTLQPDIWNIINGGGK